MARSSTDVEVCRPLNVLVGHYATSGRMLMAEAAGMAFSATDTYEWLPGGYFLLHRWDADMPGGRNQGIEVIGYDATARAFKGRSYDSQGNETVMSVVLEGDRIVLEGDAMRFSGQLVDGGALVRGTWYLRPEPASSWVPWMEVTLTRRESD